jgi:double-stranded uracil-DNA glycosylase
LAGRWRATLASSSAAPARSSSADSSAAERGLGLTNLVARPTRAAAELSAEELRAGAAELEAKVARHRPAKVAFLGVLAYRRAFGRPRAGLGPQPEPLGLSQLWVLPNPSGLQARYQLADIVDALRAVVAAGPDGE